MNPFLERLGFSPDDRAIIFHADDLGMCHAANGAFMDVLAQGMLCTGSIMAPCAWVPEITAFARERAATLDLGVHLTLNCEWTRYRWGPLSTREASSGLLDGQGYLWRDVASLHAHMDAEAAAAELRAQVERLLGAGVDVTHLDTHMGSVSHPALMMAYVGLAQEYHLPAMIPRVSATDVEASGVSAEMAQVYSGMLDEMERSGTLPIVDHVRSLSMPRGADRLEEFSTILRALPPGLTHLIYHPARPGPEIEAITHDWPMRVADRAAFTDPRLPQVLRDSGVRVMQYRQLREVMRKT
jgi:predicted glycoside hydrolase/deacetylase ChbG (UPF0249 family)